MITIIDVLKDMNVEPEPWLTWAVGAQVRELYEQEYGNSPTKALRPKTNAGGTHCFAIYPVAFKPTIVKVINRFKVNKAAQESFQFW